MAVHGRAVNDLVHLLAELLDNATYFSEPDTRISVRAAVTRKRSLAIQITDRGVGMTEQQLGEANERLADPPDLDVSVTRRMGLYVVARLAQRHGIDVRLRENEDIEGGVVARVVVPRELLTDVQTPGDGGVEPARPSQHNGSYAGVPAAAELPMRRLDGADAAVDSPADGYAQPAGGGPSAEDARWPGAEDVPEDASALDYMAGSSGRDQATTVMPAAGGQPGQDDDGQPELVPLDQPISLDDLVGGGSKAAGPFVSPAPAEEPELPKRTPGASTGQAAGSSTSAWPTRSDVSEPPQPVNPGNGTGPGHHGAGDGTGSGDNPLALPNRQPRYVAPETAQGAHGAGAGTDTSQGATGPAQGGAPTGTDGAALEEEAPTKRLPIYQSVLSRWFSEEEDAPEAGAGDESGETAVATARAGASSGGASAGGVQEDWRSVSDTGWEAAQSLLEPKGEEITTAGLPKRVPNAYLVPGSVTEAGAGAGGGGDTFTDSGASAADTSAPPTAPAAVEKPAVSRSAEAARNRMAAFQRGFTSGRHALREQPEDGTQQAESGGSADSGVQGVHGAKE
nr:ATP-binding protein [Saccharomonospora sp. CUA-673]